MEHFLTQLRYDPTDVLWRVAAFLGVAYVGTAILFRAVNATNDGVHRLAGLIASRSSDLMKDARARAWGLIRRKPQDAPPSVAAPERPVDEMARLAAESNALREAAEVLGLETNYKQEDVYYQHRKLMEALGSDDAQISWLGRKITNARDTIMKGKNWS